LNNLLHHFYLSWKQTGNVIVSGKVEKEEIFGDTGHPEMNTVENKLND
jgi:hypothetical protein